MFLQMTKEMAGDRVFLSKAVRMALPVAMQGMLNTVVNLVDTMMIGTLGATAIASALQTRCFSYFRFWCLELSAGAGSWRRSIGETGM